MPCGAIDVNWPKCSPTHKSKRARWSRTGSIRSKNDLPLVASPDQAFSATPVRAPGQGGLPPPLLGQHTDDVLREVLNYRRRSWLS